MHIMTNSPGILMKENSLSLIYFIASKRKRKNSSCKRGKSHERKTIVENEADAKPSDLLMDS